MLSFKWWMFFFFHHYHLKNSWELAKASQTTSLLIFFHQFYSLYLDGSTLKNRTPFGKRSQYLPVMKALLKVMESKSSSPNDVNTLMILTRDLLKQIPNDQFNFGPNSWLGKVIDMGLPESGDIVVNINRIPHITTQWGELRFKTYQILIHVYQIWMTAITIFRYLQSNLALVNFLRNTKMFTIALWFML